MSARSPRARSFALLALCAGCAGSAGGTDGTALHGGAASPAPPAPAPPPAAAARAGRIALADAAMTPLDLEVLPVAGGGSVLFVSQIAGERVAWLRRQGEAGALGPPIALAGEHVYGAFDGPPGRFTLVTSDGARLCLASFAVTADHPDERGCAEVAPIAIAPVGDRLALLEVAPLPLPPGKGRPAKAAAPAAPKKPKKPAAGAGKREHGGKWPAHAASAPHHPAPHLPVEVKLRWATLAGAIDAEATPTGLHFEPALDGLGFVDARARGPGIDVFWYEAAPQRKTRSALGSARLMAGSLRADGTLDFASRVAVIEGDLDYGGVRDHHGVRFTGTAAGTAFVALDGKSQCEAARVLPALARVAPQPAALCAVDPDRLAQGAPPAPDELSTDEAIFAADPRRVVGQPRSDPGLVGWAGDRAYFLAGGRLRSAARAGGAVRDEPAPLEGRRARIAWGAIAADGEAIAFAGDAVVRVDPAGTVARAPLAEGALRAGLLRAPELPEGRRRAARIAGTWWLARGDVVRVAPDPLAPPALRGAALEDSAALVGGAPKGLLIALAGEALRLTTIDAAGATAAIGAPALASPVRAGFDACERGAGGALVAGVSAADPTKAVAFAIDAEGHVSAARATPLPVRAGDFAVHLVALPGGGALLADRDRLHVVWLDDDARVTGEAPWPADEIPALCLDGRPARAAVPAPAPGAFAKLPDPAAGACMVGDPVWTTGGALLWFESAASGLDLSPALREAQLGPPIAPPAPAAITPDPSALSARAPACPGDMVSIAGRYCVDRFEDTIVDAASGEQLSPDYPTTPNLLDFVIGEWATARERTHGVHARAFPLPWLAPWRLGRKIEPLAVPRYGARSNGYVTGLVARAACAAAGKRLCSLDEFVTACRGEGDTAFPYGDTYEDGACNVFRDEHPAAILHGNASVGHLDPRLNRVDSRGRPLFQAAGQSPRCRSRWGNDAAYDLAGNLDEWVDEGGGAFAGGFYSRSTRSGCDALVTAHPFSYLDYSTGARCCRDAAGAPAAAH